MAGVTRSSALDWLYAVFDDVKFRAPHGIAWSIQTHPPASVRVQPADHQPPVDLVLGLEHPAARVSFAADLQAALHAAWGVTLPPCPTHGVALRPETDGDTLGWRCPAGDFGCAAGDYAAALWPPGPEELVGEIAPMLFRRFQRRGLREVASVGVTLRDGQRVAQVELRPGGDEAAVRAAAAPLSVEVHRAPEVRPRLGVDDRVAPQARPGPRKLWP